VFDVRKNTTDARTILTVASMPTIKAANNFRCRKVRDHMADICFMNCI
jgi:hypothetical protein